MCKAKRYDLLRKSEHVSLHKITNRICSQFLIQSSLFGATVYRKNSQTNALMY